MARYQTSVGIEVHAELSTRSKMFCRCAAEFGGEPNTRVCPVCLGLPGALPVPNAAAVEMAVRAALALRCTIARESVFHRKSYFYPDLPKGYQTSQYGETNPVGYRGWLDIESDNGGTKRIHIRRVHLEEDTGKLVHGVGGGTRIDYNRAGVPLLEIVTAFPPDVSSPTEARRYVQTLRHLLAWIGVCDGRMERGSLRCEPNVSIRPEGSDDLGTKTEIKNLNSTRSLQVGIEYEVARQAEVLESGGVVAQETRGWNEEEQSSYVMRVKEDEDDYRYFPCPDLAPMQFDADFLARISDGLPELPDSVRDRFVHQYALSPKDADRMVADREWAEWFEACVALGGDPKAILNWMISDFAKHLNEAGQAVPGMEGDPTVVTPEHLVELTQLISSGTLGGKAAKTVFAETFRTGERPGSVVARLSLAQISDTGALADLVGEILTENPGLVEDYRTGKQQVLGFLVGLAMKKTNGRADASVVKEELLRRLSES
ncbi:MAG: Asp-tRNA(Asn)/Glu-tRNA(Gln) amidotransferase subunit GatB [Fimbriimonadaceae bacterium]